MTSPEFHRPERVDAIGAGARSITVTAEAAERAALAERFGLIEIAALSAQFSVRREAAGIVAQGRVAAQVVQACVVTGAALPASVDEAVTLLFVPEATEAGDGAEEIELDANACDVIPFAGGAIDLGEAAAETMALALDPFPRSTDADAALREAGVLREEEAGPFGALASLRDKLAPGD